MTEQFDELQDDRAEYWLETGDTVSVDEWIKLTTPDGTHGERTDLVRVAERFPLRPMVIHGREDQQAGRDGRSSRPQSTEGTP